MQTRWQCSFAALPKTTTLGGTSWNFVRFIRFIHIPKFWPKTQHDSVIECDLGLLVLRCALQGLLQAPRHARENAPNLATIS